MRLGIQRIEPYTLDSLVILCSDGQSQSQLGFVIDKVAGLADVEVEALEFRKEFSKPSSLFQASITFPSEISLLINPFQLLASDILPDIQMDKK